MKIRTQSRGSEINNFIRALIIKPSEFSSGCEHDFLNNIDTSTSLSINPEQTPDDNLGKVEWVDWQLFLERVFTEGVAGLIFFNSVQFKFSQIFPENVYEKLRHDYENTTGRNMVILNCLEEVIARFKEESIALLLIRGIDFLKNLYETAGIRAMIDVDIVIHREDLTRVADVFSGLGYEHPEGYPYIFCQDGIFFDLHIDRAGFWRIDSWPQAIGISEPDIWNQACPLEDEAPNIRTLSVYDSILVSCAHLQDHSYSRLIWFVDIWCLIKKEANEFDWQYLLQRAKQYNLEKPLCFTLRYLSKYEFIDLPDNVNSFLDKLPLNFIESRSLRMLLADNRQAVSGDLLYLFSFKTLAERLRFIRQTIFIEKDNFPLFEQKITVWDYLRRFFRIVMYSVRKMFAILNPGNTTERNDTDV
ncbi:MAG: nucleotidyltransferase family protein [PVC group bacterium]|nr:nucleotidyltransferase family protein [PVC group bacterium]